MAALSLAKESGADGMLSPLPNMVLRFLDPHFGSETLNKVVSKSISQRLNMTDLKN